MSRVHRWMNAALCLSSALAIAMVGSGCQPKKDDNPAPPQIVEKEKGLTIVLVNPTTSAALSFSLSKGNKKDLDHVRWLNQTTAPVTITLKVTSPFLEPDMSFTIAPNAFSPYYTLDTGKAAGAYPYKTTPVLYTGGGPGDPDITVDP